MIKICQTNLCSTTALSILIFSSLTWFWTFSSSKVALIELFSVMAADSLSIDTFRRILFSSNLCWVCSRLDFNSPTSANTIAEIKLNINSILVQYSYSYLFIVRSKMLNIKFNLHNLFPSSSAVICVSSKAFSSSNNWDRCEIVSWFEDNLLVVLCTSSLNWSTSLCSWDEYLRSSSKVFCNAFKLSFNCNPC